MKITKYLHSCLFVEGDARGILIDPGVFTWKEEVLDPIAIDKITKIIITHPHPDHMSVDLIQAVIEAHPDVQIIGNKAVQTKLREAGVSAKMRDSSDCSVMFDAPHAPVESLAGPGTTPPNSAVHVLQKLTHPGDSLEIAETMPVLAMPFIAPWGDVMSAIDKVIELKPKFVIPIHDWFWADKGQKWLYDQIEQRLAEHNIELVVLETCVARAF